jgi:hypothetical protein
MSGMVLWQLVRSSFVDSWILLVITGYRLYIGYGIMVAGKELLCRQLETASGNGTDCISDMVLW